MKLELLLLNLLCLTGLTTTLAPEAFVPGSTALLLVATFSSGAMIVLVGQMIRWIYDTHRKVSSLILTERDWRPGDPPMSGFVWSSDSIVSGAYACRSHAKETGHPLSHGAINDVMRICVGSVGGTLRAVCILTRICDGQVIFHIAGDDLAVCKKKLADWLNHRKLVPMSFQLLLQALDVTRADFDQILAGVKGGVR